MAAQALCMRVGDGSGGAIAAGDEQPASWSAPLEVSLQGGAVCHIALPAGGAAPPAAECTLELHGRRVDRHLTFRQGCVPL